MMSVEGADISGDCERRNNMLHTDYLEAGYSAYDDGVTEPSTEVEACPAGVPELNTSSMPSGLECHGDVTVPSGDRLKDTLTESNSTQSWKEREAEMDAKLSWVKDQIKMLKQQDKSLMRQFLDLRSVINRLKLKRFGSVSNVSVADSGFYDQDSDRDDLSQSLESMPSQSCRPSLKEDDDLPVFRTRTVSLSESTKGKFSDAPRIIMQTKEVFF